MLSHEHPLIGRRAAEPEVEEEPVGARHRPEPGLRVDGLDEVRGDSGVVARESTCNQVKNCSVTILWAP